MGPQMKRHQITRLGLQGDGIADGPVYAPLTLPGDLVTGDLDGNRLLNVKIEKPSPDRVSAPCRHFRSCGGCQLQHASDDYLAAWKTEIVTSALAAQGLETTYLPISISPANSRRRATFAARRTKKGATAGFHAKASGVVVEIPNCQLLDSRVLAALPVAKALAQIGASRKHEISVSVTFSENGLDVACKGGKPLNGQLGLELAVIAETYMLARLTWQDEVIVVRTAPAQYFGDAQVVPPAGAFLQATGHAQEALVEDVTSFLAGAKHVVDLFAGCGTFTFPLAKRSEVFAVEGDAEMIKALDSAWRQTQGLKPISTAARDLFRRPLLPDELDKFDAVVIDPPRAGAEAQVAEICKTKIPKIAYVSCNPISFARDAKTLVKHGYTLGPLRVVDQFRWSTHVELAALLYTPLG